MAKLPAIIELIARHDPRSVATVTNYARVLRDDGLLPKGKRGRGAPDLDAIEVAHLVLGLAGASDAVDAPGAARLLSGATLLDGGILDGEVTNIREEIGHWSIASDCTSLGDVVASILVSEPVRTYPDGSTFGATNLDLMIAEVTRDHGHGFAELFFSDGSSRVTLNFMSASPVSSLEASRSLSWSRSTRIDLKFFYDTSRCLLDQPAPAEEGEIDPAPD